jgi:hypothetical protein
MWLATCENYQDFDRRVLLSQKYSLSKLMATSALSDVVGYAMAQATLSHCSPGEG